MLRVHLNSLVIEATHEADFSQTSDESDAIEQDVFFCRECLQYFNTVHIYSVHQCVRLQRPRYQRNKTLVYTHGQYQIFRVIPLQYRLYCQGLCLLGKLFIHEKSACYYLDDFDFYVLYNQQGMLLGFFSKEIKSLNGWNLACIMTLPPYRNSGVGKLMIDFSYWLSRVEQRIGTPERPLSQMGQLSYASYWCSVLIPYLLCQGTAFSNSVQQLSNQLYITSNDIITTLHQYQLVQHVTLQSDVVITLEQLAAIQNKYSDKWELQLRVDPQKVDWSKIVVKLSNAEVEARLQQFSQLMRATSMSKDDNSLIRRKKHRRQY